MNENIRYILMNKDKKLASLYVDKNYAAIQEIYGDIPMFIGNVSEWINHRTDFFGRTNIVKMAKLAGIHDKSDFLTITKAISINDTLWVNDLKYPTTWSKINPYTNRISKIMAEIALNGTGCYNNENLKSPSPQYRVDGSIDKCIKRYDNTLYLYKTDGEKWSDKAGCRPYSEYYCTIIENQLKFIDYAKYNIIVNKTSEGYDKPYTYCKLFTNENEGLLQMENSKFKTTPLYELDEIMPAQSRMILHEMLLLDSLTLNFDRHQGNYGFIIDNDSFKIKRFAPIYDNDCALGSLMSIQDKKLDEAYEELINSHLPKCNMGDYNDMARWALTSGLRRRLQDVGYISLGKKVQGLSDKRFQFMEYIVNRRRKEILNLFN